MSSDVGKRLTIHLVFSWSQQEEHWLQHVIDYVNVLLFFKQRSAVLNDDRNREDGIFDYVIILVCCDFANLLKVCDLQVISQEL